MKRFKTHDAEITKEVITLLYKRGVAGMPVTDEAWNIAYEIVLAGHQIEMLDWKIANLTISEPI